jgi:hypothetical protein
VNTYLIKPTAAISILAFSAFAAQAATVSSVVITETTRDRGGPAIATVTTDTSAGTAAAEGQLRRDTTAVQNADGTSAVRATAGFRANEELTTSAATYEQSETNSSGADRDYTLSYQLAEQSADMFFGFGFIVDLAQTASFGLAVAPVTPATPSNANNPFASTDPAFLPPSASPYTAASFEYAITVNGVTVFSARADALLDGFDETDVEFDSVSGFTPTAVSNGQGGVTFSVGGIQDDIFLGTFGDGETIDVISTLTARAYASGDPFSEIGGGSVNVRSSDPVSLSSVGFLTSTPTVVVPPNPNAIPLPAAGWLLIAGLGGLGALRRRTSK